MQEPEARRSRASAPELRILHVVGLFSPDHAYGGPVTVALNLARSQRAAGHSVTVIGGYRGWRRAPRVFDAQPVIVRRSVSLLGRGGLHALFAPGLIVWAVRRMRHFDVVHVHLTRDLTTLPIAALGAIFRKPVLVQPHGQVDASYRLSARLLDAALTRPTLRHAAAVAYLTPREHQDLIEVEPAVADRLFETLNGVALPETSASPARSTSVLFAARLHPRKRAPVFVGAADVVAAELSDTHFVLVGADEGDGPTVRALIEQSAHGNRIDYVGPLDHGLVLRRMLESALYVLPSTNEVFPMTVLEALAAGLPVVLGRSSVLSDAIVEAQAGLIVDDDLSAYAEAIALLMRDPERRLAMGRNAKDLAERRFSIDAVARTMIDRYRSIMD